MSEDLQSGLYELLLTLGLDDRLQNLDAGLEPKKESLRTAESADRLAIYVGRHVLRAIDQVPEKDRVRRGAEIARNLIAMLGEQVDRFDVSEELLSLPAELLVSVMRRRPDGTPKEINAPKIPLLDTTLLTNAPGEPRVGHQVLSEIESADHIDLIMAFVRRSGLRPLLSALEDHCESGGRLRVLTTTYTQSTEPEALDLLQNIGAQVRVSYDESTTRLHAKAWLFRRDSGFSTAYIGSSNLTFSAQVDGLEWNVRVSGARNPDVVDKIEAVFDATWESGDFVPYDSKQFAQVVKRSKTQDQFILPPVELRPEPFQQRLLEQIWLSRERGRHRNLLVAATGTGKTVMAALDYSRLKQTLPRARLLFIAHRKEILQQSLHTFRFALREASFGELWVDGSRPSEFRHVFASIQSLHRAHLDNLAADHFDVVVVDEFHHAAARSYTTVLNHLEPRELLGLTATPERADGLPLLEWFDGRIAAVLRLWDAIDQHRLCPFVYFGVHDGLDLSDIPWRRGRGYDVEGLSNLLTADDAWARRVIHALAKYIDAIQSIRALGFCVSVDHARFMARVFSEAGITSVAVWGDSPKDERKKALDDLSSGKIRVLFSVDLFNEGVDLPDVDTLLLLRPTDSATLFLQQLGRGLRKARGKRVCTVLDFVALHRREFRFDVRYRALLGGTRRDLERQIKEGFPFLPAGCHLELDPVASRLILDNIRQAIPSRWNAKVEELRRLSDRQREVSLNLFLEETGLELDDIYTGGRCWSDLREAAGLQVASSGRHEKVMRRALGRILHLDDIERLSFLRDLSEKRGRIDISEFSPGQQRLFRMLSVSLGGPVIDSGTTLGEALEMLQSHPQVVRELGELAELLDSRVDHLQQPLDSHPSVPLKVHARYSRIEILAAFGEGDAPVKVPAWREGVRWAKREQSDIFLFTLDKTTGGFSPTTRYRDYAISPELIHWESQSTTSADSPTGRRYQNHRQAGSSVMLFARLRNDDRAFWFLGPADYVSHRSEKPMQITWRLHHALPGDLFAEFAAAV